MTRDEKFAFRIYETSICLEGQANAGETARLSAASDSYTTPPLSINNEEERSSTERERERQTEAVEVGGGEIRAGGEQSEPEKVKSFQEKKRKNGTLKEK